MWFLLWYCLILSKYINFVILSDTEYKNCEHIFFCQGNVLIVNLNLPCLKQTNKQTNRPNFNFLQMTMDIEIQCLITVQPSYTYHVHCDVLSASIFCISHVFSSFAHAILHNIYGVRQRTVKIGLVLFIGPSAFYFLTLIT